MQFSLKLILDQFSRFYSKFSSFQKLMLRSWNHLIFEIFKRSYLLSEFFTLKMMLQSIFFQFLWVIFHFMIIPLSLSHRLLFYDKVGLGLNLSLSSSSEGLQALRKLIRGRWFENPMQTTPSFLCMPLLLAKYKLQF